MGAIARWRCRRKGHDWFLNHRQSEFIVLVDLCLRCREKRFTMPYGECLNGHPLADHWDPETGAQRFVPTCAGPM